MDDGFFGVLSTSRQAQRRDRRVICCCCDVPNFRIQHPKKTTPHKQPIVVSFFIQWHHAKKVLKRLSPSEHQQRPFLLPHCNSPMRTRTPSLQTSKSASLLLPLNFTFIFLSQFFFPLLHSVPHLPGANDRPRHHWVWSHLLFCLHRVEQVVSDLSRVRLSHSFIISLFHYLFSSPPHFTSYRVISAKPVLVRFIRDQISELLVTCPDCLGKIKRGSFSQHGATCPASLRFLFPLFFIFLFLFLFFFTQHNTIFFFQRGKQWN